MSSPVRVRFAPSPTGYLHIGGARTALFNWLFARHHGGTFVLRIEDTDAARNTPEAMAAIYDGLRWLGLQWDEGPQVGGDYGPYFQSQRNQIYEQYLQRLTSAGHIFEENGAIRFRSPREHVLVDDLVAGQIDFDLTNPETHPDMTIRRPDGSWIFHFVNVVDDIEMKISHVIRGDDHLSNTPKHIELYRALGAQPPQFAHIPLIHNQNGTKMSKRDEGAAVSYYVEHGYLPEALVNFLCLLGWSPKDDRQKIYLDEVVRIFSLKNVVKGEATFDPAKLHWLNGEYARALPFERFYALGIDALRRAGVPVETFSPDYLRAALQTCETKVAVFDELPAYARFYFTDEISFPPEATAKQFTRENKPRLQAVRNAFASLMNFDTARVEQALREVAAQLGVKLGVLVHPTRLAVTGNTAGPSLYHLLEVLGREKVLTRIDCALAAF